MKAIKYILIFYFVIFFTVSAHAKKDKLRIGAILPLTGKYSDIGVRVMNTIQLTIFELDNLDIEIYPYDTKSSKVGAKERLSKSKRKKFKYIYRTNNFRVIRRNQKSKRFSKFIFLLI